MTTRHPHLRTLGYVLAYTLGALVLVGVLTTVAQTRELVGAVRETQQTNTGTVNLIRDCTEPQGGCFKRGQRRTAGAIDAITNASVYAAACADQPGVQGSDEIFACVVRKFAEDQARP